MKKLTIKIKNVYYALEILSCQNHDGVKIILLHVTLFVDKIVLLQLKVMYFKRLSPSEVRASCVPYNFNNKLMLLQVSNRIEASETLKQREFIIWFRFLNKDEYY